MRLLAPLIAAALTTLAAAAAADEPPASTPLALSAPAAGSDLPDMGSPAAAVLSHTDEYRSEERRVGKECRSGGSADHSNKKGPQQGGSAEGWHGDAAQRTRDDAAWWRVRLGERA